MTLGFTPEEITFGDDGSLYVGQYNPGRIYRYDGITAAPIDGGSAFIDPELTGTTADDLNHIEQFAFGPDGNIYAASLDDGKIQRYSGVDGSFIDTFATPGLTGAGWPNGPTGVAFGPDGHLYVTTVDRVERYDGTTGAYIDDYIPVGGGLDNPWFSTFTPNHQVEVIPVNTAPVMTAWFNDAWDTRKELTISAANVAGDVNNFPVLITLNTDAELAAQALAIGDDIVFTAADGVTQLAHEIEFFDETTGELRVWVKTDLSSSVDTDIYMYFGNAASGPQENVAGVWDNYVGVYHLSEQPDGTPGDIVDSSGSGNHGTTEGAMDAADSVSTTIGQGLAFDGTNDKIRIPNSASLDDISDEATFSLWINYDDAADGQHQIVMTSEDRFSATDGYEWASNGDGDHFFYPDATTPDGNYNVGDNPFTNGDWHHLAATMDFATKEVKIYVDGSPMPFSSEGVPGNWTETTTSTADLLWGGNPDRAERFFLGMMDEIRIADVARSQEWLQTEYNNQKTLGTFFSVGVSEDREDKLTDINEDDFTSAGDSVLTIINSSGADRITDDDTGAVEGVAVTAVDDSNGTWQYDANADGTWLAFGAVSDTNAVLLDTGALIRFVPNADYNGSAGDLTFHAWDQTSGANGDIGIDVSANGGNTAYSSETFDATLDVIPVNDAPTGTTLVVAAVEETATAIDISANVADVDGTVVLSTTTVTSGPSNGNLTNNGDGTFSYTGNADFVGSDSFTYTVEDNDGQVSSDITVTINVSDVNDAPTGTTLVVAAVEETATAIDISANVADVDGTVVLSTTTVTGGPSNGSLTNNGDGTFTYTGNSNFVGGDSFTYTVEDNDGQVSSDITVTINVSDVNDAPTGTTLVVAAVEETATAIDISGNVADVDGTVVLSTTTVTGGPSNGSLTNNGDGTFTYTRLTANFVTAVTSSFTYTISRWTMVARFDTATVGVTDERQ